MEDEGFHHVTEGGQASRVMSTVTSRHAGHMSRAVDRAALLHATIITFVECFILYSEVPIWLFRGCLSA